MRAGFVGSGADRKADLIPLPEQEWIFSKARDWLKIPLQSSISARV